MSYYSEFPDAPAVLLDPPHGLWQLRFAEFFVVANRSTSSQKPCLTQVLMAARREQAATYSAKLGSHGPRCHHLLTVCSCSGQAVVAETSDFILRNMMSYSNSGGLAQGAGGGRMTSVFKSAVALGKHAGL